MANSAIRLTTAQRNMLSNAVHGRSLYDGLHGRSAYGGATSTVWALQQRKLLDSNGKPTDAGRAVFSLNDSA
jgi:hypothetical protein